MSAPCSTGCRPECATCGRIKKPAGRDSMDNGLCDRECEGYRNDPAPCDLWPGETRPGECGACGDMTDRFDQYGHYCGCQDDGVREFSDGEI